MVNSVVNLPSFTNQHNLGHLVARNEKERVGKRMKMKGNGKCMEWKLCLVVKYWEGSALGMRKVKEKNNENDFYTLDELNNIIC